MRCEGNVMAGGPLMAVHVPLPTEPLSRPGSDILSRHNERAAMRTAEVIPLDASVGAWRMKRMTGYRISKPFIVIDPACPDGRHPTTRCGCEVFGTVEEGLAYRAQRQEEVTVERPGAVEIVCDTEGCERTRRRVLLRNGKPIEQVTAELHESARAAGWVVGPDGDHCPGCAA